MPTKTKIEWCDFSSNPIRARRRDNGKGHWACVKVSPGCVNCYAETINKRFGTGLDYAAQSMKLVEPYLDEREIDRLMKSRKLSGKRVLIGDMTDIFGEWVTDKMLGPLVHLFMLRPDVTWIILTKRAERMARYFSGPAAPNIWMGASVENADHAFRIEDLRKARASIKFLSLEPLLGPLPALNLHGIDWVIVGGESGTGARSCHIEWIEDIVEQCQESGVPVFVKQLGAKPRYRSPLIFGYAHLNLKSPKGGDMAEWTEHLRVREFPVEKETS